jgi:hypothetical protein
MNDEKKLEVAGYRYDERMKEWRRDGALSIRLGNDGWIVGWFGPLEQHAVQIGSALEYAADRARALAYTMTTEAVDLSSRLQSALTAAANAQIAANEIEAALKYTPGAGPRRGQQ